MNLKTVDLYQYFGLEKPDFTAGTLHCYIQKTDNLNDPPRPRVAALVIPGGGYGHVSDREAEPVALRFLTAGCNAFVLDYSIAPVRFPAQLREAAMAVRYIRENADELGVSPSMIGAVGFSAGGHLCGLLGTMFDCPELADIGPARLLRPDALGLCYPVAVSWGPTHGGSFDNLCGEDMALRQRLSLERLVRPDMPPAFVWHTRNDDTVPCRNSLILAQAMEEKGVDFALHIYRNGAHGLSTADGQVYAAGQLPGYSWDVPGWVESLQRFWKESGMDIRSWENRA